MSGTTTTTRLLLIDADEAFIQQFKAVLAQIKGRTFNIDIATSAEAAKEQIRIGKHALRLIDCTMAIESEDLRNSLAAGSRPFIMLGTETDGNADNVVMESRASDYLAKERLSAETLERAIRYAIDRHATACELQQVNHELRMKNEELQNFVYTVSHDLKSPVVTLAGFAGHFKRDVEQGRTDRLALYAERFSTAALRMKENVDDLLELSRAGNLATPLASVDVRLLVWAILADMDELIKQQGVQVEVADRMPSVTADGKRVRRAMLELISNALHHGCGTGATTIRIGAEDRGDEVVYHVIDNGAGIAAEDRVRIFELFQRCSDHSKGNGMGLALVRRIAEAHMGRVWVECDGATSFYLALPKHAQPGPAVDAA